MVISLAWSLDGGILAAGYLNGDIILWGAASGARILTIGDYTRVRSDTNGVAWSLDGRQLVYAPGWGCAVVGCSRAAICCWN